MDQIYARMTYGGVSRFWLALEHDVAIITDQVFHVSLTYRLGSICEFPRLEAVKPESQNQRF